MSAYVSLGTPMTDQDCLVAALGDMGIRKVEVHATPVPLVGYKGDKRIQHAHVVIRRKHVGFASNDIGFERSPMGFRAHVSEFDQKRYGPDWMRRLHISYAIHDTAKQEARKRQTLQGAAPDTVGDENRRQVVEAQRQAIYAKAQKLGYRVEETRQGDTVRLALVKRVY
jgi:hypothetical protein